MAEPDQARQSPREPLTGPRLYTGDQDVERELYVLPLGEVAAASIGDHEKPRPNEDAAAIIPVGESHLVLVVADGVGGLGGARKASTLTVEAIRDALAGNEPPPERGLRTAIMDGIESANQRVLTSGNGGASTLALAEIGPDYVRSYHVGDSILMLCGQRGRLKFLTTPHSPVGFAREAGLLDEEEALNHEELNLIFNVIGSADMSIEVGSEQPMAPHDTLLLASDGLTDNLLQGEIIERVRKGPLDEALGKLTVLAQQRMQRHDPDKPSKPDDCTVLLFRRQRQRRR